MSVFLLFRADALISYYMGRGACRLTCQRGKVAKYLITEGSFRRVTEVFISADGGFRSEFVFCSKDRGP